MAKSLRSKWKRKMKAAKRVRYGEKEKAMLVKMLDDAKAAELDPIVRVTKTFKTSKPAEEAGPSSDSMEVEKKPVEGFSSKSLMNKNGTFPVWVSKRKIKKLTGQAKKVENKKKQRASRKSKF